MLSKADQKTLERRLTFVLQDARQTNRPRLEGDRCERENGDERVSVKIKVKECVRENAGEEGRMRRRSGTEGQCENRGQRV